MFDQMQERKTNKTKIATETVQTFKNIKDDIRNDTNNVSPERYAVQI